MEVNTNKVPPWSKVEVRVLHQKQQQGLQTLAALQGQASLPEVACPEKRRNIISCLYFYSKNIYLNSI